MDSKKVQSLVSHILDECESRGFSISDVKLFLTAMPIALNNAIAKITENQRFKSE